MMNKQEWKKAWDELLTKQKKIKIELQSSGLSSQEKTEQYYRLLKKQKVLTDRLIELAQIRLAQLAQPNSSSVKEDILKHVH